MSTGYKEVTYTPVDLATRMKNLCDVHKYVSTLDVDRAGEMCCYVLSLLEQTIETDYNTRIELADEDEWSGLGGTTDEEDSL